MSDAITTILIVEDDPALQEVYALILSSQGYRVLTAGDGAVALNVLHKTVPDVIMLDYFMPNMDGKGFLQHFDSSEYPNTKIFLASNISDQHAIDEMLALGADEYVLKSDITPSELISVVERLSGVAAT